MRHVALLGLALCLVSLLLSAHAVDGSVDAFFDQGIQFTQHMDVGPDKTVPAPVAQSRLE